MRSLELVGLGDLLHDGLLLRLPAAIVDVAVSLDDLSTQDRRILLVRDKDLSALVVGELVETVLVVLLLESGSRDGSSDLNVDLTLETLDETVGERKSLTSTDLVDETIAEQVAF